jgi:hypothetical protein
LIEALLRARRGQRVVIVDDNDRLGGCWRTSELFEIGDVEGACHLLENYRGAYDFLEEIVGLPMRPCAPAPDVLYPNGRRVPYISRTRTVQRLMSILARMPIVSAARALEWATAKRLLFRRTSKFRLSEAARRIGTLSRHPFVGSRQRRAVKYFDGGGPRMLSSLREQLQRLEVRILHARAVTLALPQNGEVHLQLDADRGASELLVAGALVATESACLDSIVTFDRIWRFERRETVHPHLLVEVEGLDTAEFSYVQLPGDPFIPRISDVTDYCTGRDGSTGRRVFVVQLHRVTSEDLDELTGSVMNHLHERGLIPRHARATRSRRADIVSPSTSPDAANALHEMRREEVAVLPSRGDLCLTILQSRVRWLAIQGAPARQRDTSVTAEPSPACAHEEATLP